MSGISQLHTAAAQTGRERELRIAVRKVHSRNELGEGDLIGETGYL